MNTKIICEGSSIVVPDQSDESFRDGMRRLGYRSMERRANIQFFRVVAGGYEVCAPVVIEPTNDPLTP